MKIEMVAPDSVKVHPDNPRKITTDVVEKVARSIEQFGFRQPIVVDKDRVIVIGTVRWHAAKKLGLEKVPVHVAADLKPEQVAALRIADNRLSELTEWDDRALETQLAQIAASGIDLAFLDFELEPATAKGAVTVREIDTADLKDDFWITVRGPLKHQAHALQQLRKLQQELPGVVVELGTVNAIPGV